MITEQQKQQILQQGMDLEKVEEQIKNFIENFPFLNVQAPATIGEGIRQLSNDDLQFFINTYEQGATIKEIVKFVPASGAASRMFKDLYSFLDSDEEDPANIPFIQKFFDGLSSFAFYDDLEQSMRAAGNDLKTALQQKNYKLILTNLLGEEGLGYGDLPKGLLKFHSYGGENRTPTHEHFVEGAEYGLGKDNMVRLHFTVSPEHQEKFKNHVKEIRSPLEEKYAAKFEVSFSQQKKSTDTIAVNLDNTPFLEDNGDILFRPAGHGALLENLNDIDADIVFIKNIDNVVPDRLKENTIMYKKAIGGMLLHVQEKVFEALNLLTKTDENSIAVAEKVYAEELGARFPINYSSYSMEEKESFLRQKLNRPIRVCGMVENTGEPGGGPFWVLGEDDTTSLQIAETAQLNLEDETQKKIFHASTHFNPTDLVCGIKDFKGKKFDLLKYRDPKTGFITQKSKNGKGLKAQELPGLWNGSMSDWNSIFVEVPLITFNPVKTVNDLLREVHQ
jgi:hypothetical protein